MDIFELIQNLELPQFRKKQILHGIFHEFKPSFSQISTLPSQLREELDSKHSLRTLKMLKVLVSKNNDTIKWSFLTAKGKPIETVLMLHENGRRTICISCQSGCPVNCSFCWTGAMGFQQNLSSWEIIEQLLVVNEWLKENHKALDDEEPKFINRVVYMGMGEPMINLVEVTKSIDLLINPDLFNLGQRSITVSTSGYIPMMKKFWSQYPKIGVAISLHAPTQEIRAQIMPVAKQYGLDELMSMCLEIQALSKRRITYEYILIENITDTEENADALAKLLRGQLAHVNLIPYNPIEGREFKRPSRNRVMRFMNSLRSKGISATARVTMGDDIKAACGQLSKHEDQ